MERPIFKPVGTPTEALDTPSLIVDIADLTHNLRTVAGALQSSAVKLRPQVAAHRTPAIAHAQLAAGGHVGGIATTSLGQAEVFSQNGFSDIFVANLIVTAPKIARLCALARRATMRVSVDDAANVAQLSEAAAANGVCLQVVVHVASRSGFYGVEPGKRALELARSVDAATGLEFMGLTTDAGMTNGDDPADAASAVQDALQPLLDTRAELERAGLDVRVVSAGGTSNYDVVGAMDGVTEVRPGAYALMDAQHAARRPELRVAGKVMATVTSRPEPGYMITDGGQKAIGADAGFPTIDNLPSPQVKGLSAEHGSIYFDASDGADPQLGDRIWCAPYDGAACANLHDYIFAVRDGKLEAVWDVAARGRYQ